VSDCVTDEMVEVVKEEGKMRKGLKEYGGIFPETFHKGLSARIGGYSSI